MFVICRHQAMQSSDRDGDGKPLFAIVLLTIALLWHYNLKPLRFSER